MNSVLSRLWRIGKASAFKDRQKIEQEITDWEDDLSRRKQGDRQQQKPPSPSPYSQELQDAFGALEVPVGASWGTSLQAYRKMAQKYHPDKWHNDPKREVAEELFNKINQAFDLIKSHYGKR